MSLVLEWAIPNLMFDQKLIIISPAPLNQSFWGVTPPVSDPHGHGACTLGEATMRLPPVMPWSSYSYGDPGHILIEGVVGLLKGRLRANHQQPLAIYSPGTVGGDS